MVCTFSLSKPVGVKRSAVFGAVDVELGTTIDSGSPRMLFDTGLDIDPVYSQYLVHPNGQKFLLAKPAAEQTSRPITVVLNWQAQLNK